MKNKLRDPLKPSGELKREMGILGLHPKRCPHYIETKIKWCRSVRMRGKAACISCVRKHKIWKMKKS